MEHERVAAAAAGVDDLRELINKKGEPDDEVNPVSYLNEYCDKNRVEKPCYFPRSSDSSGPPFRMTVKMGSLVGNGSGPNKKEAKRIAALDLVTQLKENNNVVVEKAKVPSLESEQSQVVQGFYQKLQDQADRSKWLATLHYISLRDPELDSVDVLEKLSKELMFTVTYVNLEEKTVEDEFQCLVQLSTFPVAVCHGVGASDPKAAKDNAARNALEYLKVMTKNSIAELMLDGNRRQDAKSMTLTVF